MRVNAKCPRCEHLFTAKVHRFDRTAMRFVETPCCGQTFVATDEGWFDSSRYLTILSSTMDPKGTIIVDCREVP